MAISNAIEDLKSRVLSAYGACEEKGAELPSVKNTANLPDCIRSISSGSPLPVSYEDVCKEVEFCQSELLAQGGKGDYAGAWIGLRYSGIDYENFSLGSSNVVAVRTSDGAFYSYAAGNRSVTHHWDSTKDFDIEGIETEHKFNWVIYYFSSDSIASNSSYLDCAKIVNIVYVFDMNLKYYYTAGSTHNAYGLCQYNDIVQSFDFVNNHKCYGNTATDFSRFCYHCHSLAKLPDGLDTSSGTDFSYFCDYCYSLAKLPDNLDTSSATRFYYFCNNCYVLTELPDNLDASSVTNFSDFCCYCYSLTKLPDNFDTSSGKIFSSFCYDCYALKKLPDNLDVSHGTNFANFCYGCYSLTKLPDSLDTSSGDYFYFFCCYCYSLTKLPDNLDTSKSTDFSNFCSNCYSLTQANIVLPSACNLTTLNVSNKLSVASMRYIADHAPTTSGHTLTIGSTNKARANAYDPTIITTLTSKGWTVN